ncbi:MAG: hypothetical protein KAJ40_06225, partial [Alphaproteobacteria bacterium]|nr:hypothetical protein [Alphaproteobacteria bacterium]
GATGTHGQETIRAQSAPELSIVPDSEPNSETMPTLKTLQDVIVLLEKHDELLLASQLYYAAHFVKLNHDNYGASPKGKIELRLEETAQPDLSQNLRKTLCEITGQIWMVVLSNASGAPTLASIDEATHMQEMQDIAKVPLVENILELFPDAKLINVVHNTSQNKE